MHQHSDDKQLLEQLKQDSDTAFSAIYERYREAVFMMAYYTLDQNRTKAEDITQDVFLHLWKIRQKLEITESLRNYLLISAKNKSLDEKKKRSHHAKYVQRAIEQSQPEQPSPKVEKDDVRKNIIDVLKTVKPVIGSKAFYLFHLEQLSHDEIAHRLNISGGTSRNYVNLVFRKLQDIFKNSSNF